MSSTPSPAEPSIVVSFDFELEPELDGRDAGEVLASEETVTVRADGRRLVLDAADERSAGFVRVIERLREQRRPVAFEATDDDRIARLFVPHVSTITGTKNIDRGAVGVDLRLSHGRHVLRESNPAFDRLHEIVTAAVASGDTVVLVEDDDHDVLDVRVVEGAPAGSEIVADGHVPDRRGPLRAFREWFVHWLTCACSFPWSLFRSISRSRAQSVFDDLASRVCDPLTAPAPCIPFNYPDDGCWGRAHEMCRLMVADGLKPCKVWIEGTLNVDTANSPNCEVWWRWHVAPTHCVRGGGLLGWFRIRSMVFDPALFDGPVSRTTWKGAQDDPNAVLTASPWTTFYLWGTGTHDGWDTLTDPGFQQTNSVLSHYRTALMNRSVNFTPPPYSYCP